MSYEFNPDSWNRAAAAFDDGSGTIGGLNVQMSVGGGPTATDSALSEMVARVNETITAATGGLGGGLSADADQMRATGSSYDNTEDSATQAGCSFGGR